MSLLTLFAPLFQPASTTSYQNLITSEHVVRPRFVSVIETLVQPFADIVQAALGLPTKFDLHAATGNQLDMTGQWIGPTRFLSPPAAAAAGQTSLDDTHYSQLLQGLAVLNNQWDGSIPLAYSPYLTWWANQPGTPAPVIQDNGNLTMTIGQAGFVMDAQTAALFNNGYLDTRPAGVAVKAHVAATAAAPLFGLAPAGSPMGAGMAGLGTGCWGKFTPAS